jgi:hypothetical protein
VPSARLVDGHGRRVHSQHMPATRRPASSVPSPRTSPGGHEVHGGSIKGPPKVTLGDTPVRRMRSTSAWMPGEATLCVLRHGAQRAEACPCSQLSLSAMEMSPYDAGCCAASGYTYRRFCPRPVRYTSATTLTRRTTAARNETTRDKKKTARYAAYMQRTGRFRRWWQVLGSNQRRLSRRFYSVHAFVHNYASEL